MRETPYTNQATTGLATQRQRRPGSHNEHFEENCFDRTCYTAHVAAQQTACHAAHGVCCGHRRATRSQLPQRRLCVPQAARLRSAVVHCCATYVAGYAERSALHRACVDRRRGCCCRRRSSSAHRRHSRICRRYVDPSQSSHVGAFSTRRGPPTLAAPEDIF